MIPIIPTNNINRAVHGLMINGCKHVHAQTDMNICNAPHTRTHVVCQLLVYTVTDTGMCEIKGKININSLKIRCLSTMSCKNRFHAP